MPWEPNLKSTGRHFIAANLLAYIRANQTAALLWAKTELAYAGTVPDFAHVFNSSAGRVVTVWPNLMLVRAGTVTAEPDDDYSTRQVHDFGFEMAIADGDPDNLTHLVEVYTVAADSMLRNVPHATLAAGLASTGRLICNVLSVDRDQTRSREGESVFLQAPRLTARVTHWEVS